MKPVKRARRIAALAMAGLLLLLSACTPASPKAALAKAFAGMARLDSLSFTAQVQWEQDGVPLAPLSFQGDWIKEPLAMRIQSTMEIDPQLQWDMTVTAYILEKPEGAYTLYTGLSIPEVTELWYSQDITEILASVPAAGLAEATELYLEGLQDLTLAGEETVGGSACVRYDGILDGEVLGQMLQEAVLEMAGDSLLPEGLDPEDAEDWVLSDLPIRFWLDKDSGLLLRLYLELNEVTGTILDSGEAFNSICVTMDFGNFNNVAPLELPEEARGADSAGTGSSGTPL